MPEPAKSPRPPEPDPLIEESAKKFSLVAEGKGAIALVLLAVIGLGALEVTNATDFLQGKLLPLGATVVVMAVLALIVRTLSTNQRAREILGWTATGLIGALMLLGFVVVVVLVLRWINPPPPPPKPPPLPKPQQELPPPKPDGMQLMLLFNDTAGVPAKVEGAIKLDIAGEREVLGSVRGGRADFPGFPARLLGRKAAVTLDAASFDLTQAEITLQTDELQYLVVAAKGEFKGSVVYDGQPVAGVKLTLIPFGPDCVGTTGGSGSFAIRCKAAIAETSPEVTIEPPAALALKCPTTRINNVAGRSKVDLTTLCERKHSRSGGSGSTGSGGGTSGERHECRDLEDQVKAALAKEAQQTITPDDGVLVCTGNCSKASGYAYLSKSSCRIFKAGH